MRIDTGQTVILLAEDMPDVRNFLAAALRQENFIVVAACNAGEALQLFHGYGNVDVILTDVQLGAGMNGVELAEHILRERPTTKALLMSGFPDAVGLAAEKGLPFLSKPFLPSALVERLREVLDGRIPAGSEGKPEYRRVVG